MTGRHSHAASQQKWLQQMMEWLEKNKCNKLARILLLVSRKRRMNRVPKRTTKDLVGAWEMVLKDAAPSKHSSTKLKCSIQQQQKPQAWSLEALEESLVSKQEKKAPVFVGSAQKVSINDSPPVTLDASLSSVSCKSLLLQPLVSSAKHPSTDKWVTAFTNAVACTQVKKV